MPIYFLHIREGDVNSADKLAICLCTNKLQEILCLCSVLLPASTACECPRVYKSMDWREASHPSRCVVLHSRLVLSCLWSGVIDWGGKRNTRIRTKIDGVDDLIVNSFSLIIIILMDHLMAGYHTLALLLNVDGHLAGISFYDRAPFDCDQSIVSAFWITPEISARLQFPMRWW